MRWIMCTAASALAEVGVGTCMGVGVGVWVWWGWRYVHHCFSTRRVGDGHVWVCGCGGDGVTSCVGLGAWGWWRSRWDGSWGVWVWIEWQADERGGRK